MEFWWKLCWQREISQKNPWPDMVSQADSGGGKHFASRRPGIFYNTDLLAGPPAPAEPQRWCPAPPPAGSAGPRPARIGLFPIWRRSAAPHGVGRPAPPGRGPWPSAGPSNSLQALRCLLSGIILPGEPPLRQATQTHMAPELQRCYIPCSPENSASLALSFL